MASESDVKPFVTHFQGKTQLTSCDFLKIFRAFDKDGRFKLAKVFFFFFLVPYLEVRTIFNSALVIFDVTSPVENTVVVFLIFDR